jgi:hypothetical protein
MPFLIVRSRRFVQNMNIVGDSQTKTGEMGRKREVQIIMVKPVKSHGIKGNLLDHRPASGKEKSVHRMNPPECPPPRIENQYDKRVLKMPLGDLPENIRRAGRHPFATNQPVGPGDADQIEIVQMVLQTDREIRIENFDVIMAEDEIFPAALRKTACVALAQ